MRVAPPDDELDCVYPGWIPWAVGGKYRGGWLEKCTRMAQRPSPGHGIIRISEDLSISGRTACWTGVCGLTIFSGTPRFCLE